MEASAQMTVDNIVRRTPMRESRLWAGESYPPRQSSSKPSTAAG
ncbi:hypothetical protein ACQP2X_17650 [Actinoplanes sp. CA-131856]